jgi:DNA-directed RNA polymerase subunit beta
MNVGQVLETHLGWAAKGIGFKIAEMADDKAHPDHNGHRIWAEYILKDVL